MARPNLEALSVPFQAFKGKVRYTGRDVVARTQAQVLVSIFGEPKFIRPVQPEFEEGFEPAFAEVAKDPNVLIVGVAGAHEHHADGLPLAKVSEELTTRIWQARGETNSFPGFILTIAKTVETPDQSLFLMHSNNRLKPIFSKYHMSTAGYTRDVDRDRYDSDSTNAAYMLHIGRGIHEGRGLLFLPEASVQAGRRKPGATSYTDINGMQPFKGDFTKIHEMAQRHGKRIVFVYIGMHGSFRIVIPETHHPRWDQLIPHIIDPRQTSLVTVKVSIPEAYEVLVEEIQSGGKEVTMDTLNDALGPRVARYVPDHVRGVYA